MYSLSPMLSHCLPWGRGLALLLCLLSLAVPVRAQGQSPTTPVSRPGVGSEIDSGDSRSAPDEKRPSLREMRDETGKRLGERDGDKAEGKPEDAGGDKPTVIDQSANTPAPEGDGTTIIQGGPPPGAPGKKQPGAPNAPQPPPARGQQGGGSGVSVVGGAGPFEPLLQRKLEWPELPPAGEPIDMEGPIPLSEFLQTINLATNWNVVASQESQQIQLGFFIFTQKPPAEAMKLLQQYNLHYHLDEPTNTLYVMTMKEAVQEQFGDLATHEFVVRNAEVSYVESVLASLISPVGRAITAPLTGHIYVWDTQDNLDYMIKIVDELDVPMQKEEFTIQFADMPDIQTALQSLLSPNGRLMADPRTGQIFVWDSPGALDQMRSAVASLDVPVETRTIAIRYLDAENIVENLSALVSERGLVQVDPRTNAVVMTDLPGRITRMASLIETLDKPVESRSWRLAYADPEFVADELEDLIPEAMGKITLNEELNQLTIKGIPDRLDEIDKLIKDWDVARSQVHIEAYIVEVGSDVERAFNINWSYFGNNGSVPIVLHSGDGGPEGVAAAPGDGEALSIGQLPYVVPAYGDLQLNSSGNIVRPLLTNTAGEQVIDHFGGKDLSVALDYLDKQNKATILSSPRLTVEDGEEAVFENKTQVPYVSSTTIFGGNFGNTNNNLNNINNTNRVEFVDVGTILTVLPRINQEGNINLEIDAEDSTFVFRNILSNGQVSTIPEKTERHAQTELRVNSGDTVVLGGLRRDRASREVTKTPLLGDLPVVGRLFRNPARNSSNNTLLIFITTVIVDGSTDPESTILAKAEDDIASQLRHDKKSLWGRLLDSATGNKNELRVSIGESGEMHSQGDRVTVEELLEAFNTAPVAAKVVLRPHPRAPKDIVSKITEAAMEANLKIELDQDMVPLVPNYGANPPAAEAAEAAQARPAGLVQEFHPEPIAPDSKE